MSRKKPIPADAVEQMNKVISEHTDKFKVLVIQEDNFVPHQYSITKELLKFAINKCGGKLDDDTIRKHENELGRSGCGMEKCKLLYGQHLFKRGAVLKLNDHVPNSLMLSVLPLLDSLCKRFQIDGYAIQESEQKYRVYEDADGSKK